MYYLCLGDFIFSLSNFIYLDPQPPVDVVRCDTQAAMKLFGAQSTFISSFFLCYCLYRSIIQSKMIQTTHIGWVAFGVPLLISFVPILLDSYGSDHFTCFFKRHSHLESILIFEIQVWVVQVLNIVLIVRVLLELRQVTDANQDQLSQPALDLKLSRSIVQLIIFYPLIQCLCWSPFTTNHFLAIFGLDLKLLSNIQFIFASSTGFFNTIVYCKTKQVQTWYRKESLCIDMSLEHQNQRHHSVSSSESDIPHYE